MQVDNLIATTIADDDEKGALSRLHAVLDKRTDPRIDLLLDHLDRGQIQSAIFEFFKLSSCSWISRYFNIEPQEHFGTHTPL